MRVLTFCNRLLLAACYYIALAILQPSYGQGVFCYEKSLPTNISLSSSIHVTFQKTGFYDQELTFLKLKDNYVKNNLNSQNQLQVYILTIDSFLVDSVLLTIPKKIANSKSTIKAIAHSTKYISILTHEDLIVYDRTSTGTPLHHTLKLEYAFNDVVFISDTLLVLSTCYDYHPKDQKEKCLIVKYNPKNQTIISKKDFKVDGIEFTYFVNKLYDFNANGNFILASKNYYYIGIYNSNNELIDSIVDNNPKWVEADQEKLIEIDKENSRNKIETLYEYYDEVSRIEKVFFPSDSMVIVSYKVPHSGDRFRTVDVWTKSNNNNWQKKVDGYVYKFDLMKSEGTITRCTVPLHVITSSSPTIYFKENKLIYLNAYHAPLSFDVPFNKYYNSISSYLKVNGCKYAIDFYTIND